MSRRRQPLARVARAVAIGGGALLASLAVAAPASAASLYPRDISLAPGSFKVEAYNLVPDGRGGTMREQVTQAGASPQYLETSFDIEQWRREGAMLSEPTGSMKDLRVVLPAGFVGNPLATPRCTMADYFAFRCPASTIVGTHILRFMGQIPGMVLTLPEVAVYNVVPPRGAVAQFAFQAATVTVILTMSLRDDGNYELVTDIKNSSQMLIVTGSTVRLFGTPANLNGPGDRTLGLFRINGPSTLPPVPLVSLPASCGLPAPATIRLNSWFEPERYVTESFQMPAVTGCEKQPFEPTLDLRPERPRAGAPSAYEVSLKVPQAPSGASIAVPPLKRAVVTLPEGVVVSPSNASGLVGCTDVQAKLTAAGLPDCPDASRIGSVEIDAPALERNLQGSIFLGQPKSMDSQTGEMLRIFLVASDPDTGVVIKQEGRIVPDPVTGRLVTTFDNSPQQPFSLLTMRFNGGERAPLSNPQQCGTYTTNAVLTSWGGQEKTVQSSFEITEGPLGTPCGPLGFAPSFLAGMDNPAAGQSSTFTLAFGRNDAQQDLSTLDVTLPAGLMGMVSQTELCDEAAANAGTCGENTRIGSVRTTAGPGQNPIPVPGRGAYLTGPYKGGAFGLSIVVPAIAGPFDLGTVVVRAAIHIDRKTAALRVVSDPMPTILQGIPLRMRNVTVAIDKPGFMVNPTSCSVKQVSGTMSSAQGATANVSSRFQAAGCRSLPYRPKLALQIGARGRTKNGVTTPFQAKLTMPAGNVANRAITVKLPRTINSRLQVINEASCSIQEFESERCDKPVGTAFATTPVLRGQVRGDLYFVRNPARRIPDLMVRLKGEGREAGVLIDLAGKVTIPRDLTLRTDFDTIPDVPINGFQLNLVAGRRGAIGLIGNACQARVRRQAIANLAFRAHNGALKTVRQRLSVAGCGRASTAKKVKQK